MSEATLAAPQKTTAATPSKQPPGLDDPSLYINRELSWLEFNRRVLEEAKDPAVPLLERVKFLAIFASNMDEFFMVRVGGLQQKVLHEPATMERLLDSGGDAVAQAARAGKARAWG